MSTSGKLKSVEKSYKEKRTDAGKCVMRRQDGAPLSPDRPVRTQPHRGAPGARASGERRGHPVHKAEPPGQGVDRGAERICRGWFESLLCCGCRPPAADDRAVAGLTHVCASSPLRGCWEPGCCKRCALISLRWTLGRVQPVRSRQAAPGLGWGLQVPVPGPRSLFYLSQSDGCGGHLVWL